MSTTPQTVTDGAVLQAMREGAGLSRRALAPLVGPDGISHQHLGLLESGERVLNDSMRLRIAQAIADHVNADAA